MKENESKLIPINQLNQVSQRLDSKLHLPDWIDTDQIGINLGCTERLMNLGGIRKISLTAERNGRPSTAFLVNGVSKDGSAYAGKVVISEQPTYHYDNDTNIDHRKNLLHCFQNSIWTDVVVGLDFEAIKDRIDNKREDLRNPKSWSKPLDHALRDSIREAGTQHLLKGHDKIRRVIPTLLYTYLLLGHINVYKSFLEARLNQNLPIPAEVACGVVFIFNTFVGLTVPSLLIHGKVNEKGKGYRLSLIPGYEVDRATVLQFLTRVQPLIKTIEP